MRSLASQTFASNDEEGRASENNLIRMENGGVPYVPVSGYCEETLSRLLNGVHYMKEKWDSVVDYVTYNSSDLSREAVFSHVLSQNCNRTNSSEENRLRIQWRPTRVVNNNDGTKSNYGNLLVYLNEDSSATPYYQESDFVIVVSPQNTCCVYLQAHWGSGVTFKSISVDSLLH